MDIKRIVIYIQNFIMDSLLNIYIWIQCTLNSNAKEIFLDKYLNYFKLKEKRE